MTFMVWNPHLETGNGIGIVDHLVVVEQQTGARLKVHVQRKSTPLAIDAKQGVA